MSMTPDSFEFNGINSVDEWGIMVTAYDVLLPPKRPRKMVIPGRSGAYDFGARNWDERPLRIACQMQRTMRKADFRDVIYALSQKGEIRLSEEPDKYYIGEIYDSPEVETYYMEAGREFELIFTCEPFALSALKTIPIHTGSNPIEYHGTAPAPAKLTLTNVGNTTISNIQIIIRRRKG